MQSSLIIFTPTAELSACVLATMLETVELNDDTLAENKKNMNYVT